MRQKSGCCICEYWSFLEYETAFSVLPHNVFCLMIHVCSISLGKTEKLLTTSNISAFLTFCRTSCHFHQIWNCCLQILSVRNSLKFVISERVNLSQTSPGFYVSAVYVFRKQCWKKEKLLIMSNFSFSHSVFYPFGELSIVFIKFEIIVCNFFQLGRVLNLSFWKGLMKMGSGASAYRSRNVDCLSKTGIGANCP